MESLGDELCAHQPAEEPEHGGLGTSDLPILSCGEVIEQRRRPQGVETLPAGKVYCRGK